MSTRAEDAKGVFSLLIPASKRACTTTAGVASTPPNATDTVAFLKILLSFWAAGAVVASGDVGTSSEDTSSIAVEDAFSNAESSGGKINGKEET